MTAPRNPTSYAEALQMATALRAADKPATDPVSVVQHMSEQMIRTRERSAQYAKSAIRALWRTVDPYNEAQVRNFAQQAAKLLAPAQAASARAAAAGQVKQLAALGVDTSAAVPSSPVNVRASGVSFRRGAVQLRRKKTTVDYDSGPNAEIKPAEMTNDAIFERPAKVFRFAASQGRADAEQRANDRIDSLVDDNLMLAQRLAQQEVIAKVDLDHKSKSGGSPIIGYRRVIHPEMSRGGTCGMCIVASERVYHVGTLMPIHDDCHCTIAPVTKAHDPGSALNNQDLALKGLYGHGGGNTNAHLKRTRYQVDEHGELGSVLVPKKPYKPRSEKSKRLAGSKRATLQPPQETAADVARRNLPLFKQHLARMLADGVPEGSPKIDYMRRMIAKFDTAA